MRVLRAPACAAVLAAALAPCVAADEDALAPGWYLCNQTSFVLEAAHASGSEASMEVRGWVQLAPGTCAAVATGVRADTLYAAYARTASVHRGEPRAWRGERALCAADSGSFSLTAGTGTVCPAGSSPALFADAAAAGEGVWRTVFEQSAEFGDLETAGIAGLQRLLHENDILVGAIDGVAGARLDKGLRDFRAREDLEDDVSGEALLAHLIDGADARTAKRGLDVCNETAQTVVAAVATRAPERARARGWWRIEPQSCLTILRELPRAETELLAHVAAEGGTAIARSGTALCISDLPFDIVGGEDCEGRGYQPANFQAVAREENQTGVALVVAPSGLTVRAK